MCRIWRCNWSIQAVRISGRTSRYGYVTRLNNKYIPHKVIAKAPTLSACQRSLAAKAMRIAACMGSASGEWRSAIISQSSLWRISWLGT